MITPNQFEAEKLTGDLITDQESAIKVIHKLHKLGPELVIITSTNP